MELEIRQKVTLGLFTLSNLYEEDLQSKGWNRQQMALAAKDIVDICLFSNYNKNDDTNEKFLERGKEKEDNVNKGKTDGDRNNKDRGELEDEEDIMKKETEKKEETEKNVPENNTSSNMKMIFKKKMKEDEIDKKSIRSDNKEKNELEERVESQEKIEEADDDIADVNSIMSKTKDEIETMQQVDVEIEYTQSEDAMEDQTALRKDVNNFDKIETLKKLVKKNAERANQRVDKLIREEEHFLALKRMRVLEDKEKREHLLASMDDEGRRNFLKAEDDKLRHEKKQEKMLKSQLSAYKARRKKSFGSRRKKKKKNLK